MLRMQQMAFPGFKFKKFSAGVCPQTPLYMRGSLDLGLLFLFIYSLIFSAFSHEKTGTR
jgi:hypothetical protein